jgi:hypothetical protein
MYLPCSTLRNGKVLVIGFARGPFVVAYVASDLHRDAMAERQELNLVGKLIQRAGSLNYRVEFHQQYVHISSI